MKLPVRCIVLVTVLYLVIDTILIFSYVFFTSLAKIVALSLARGERAWRLVTCICHAHINSISDIPSGLKASPGRIQGYNPNVYDEQRSVDSYTMAMEQGE